MTASWTLIHNPKSASGKGATALPGILRLLNEAGIPHTLHSTTHPGHARQLAAEALRAGARRLVAVGGDGTVNEVVNGILDVFPMPGPDVWVTQIPIGTGNDWRRTHGIPTDPRACVAMLKTPRTVVQDVGLVEWTLDGVHHRRHFVNIAGIGFEAFAGLAANQNKAAGKGGIMGYVKALLSSLRHYQAQPAVLTLDGIARPEAPVYSGAIGICKYNGGGMKQCPDAIIDDGLFDFTLIGQISKGGVLLNVPRLFSGTFTRHPAVSQHRVNNIHVEGPPGLLLEVDGENLGHVPARFSILPGALTVVAGTAH